MTIFAVPSMPVKVVIVTRFNVPLKGGARTDRAGLPTNTQEWLERRFDLFERICLPSMMAQTDPDFTWIVFFGEQTPGPFRARIAAIHARFPAFTPRYLVDGQNVPEDFRKEVLALLTPEDTHVITGRIDNDDAFNRGMVARLRAEFNGQDMEFLNFIQGVQYDMEQGVAGLLRKPSNPFIALIERIRDGDVRTVIHLMHHEAQETGFLRDIETVPMWLQLIHAGNLENRFKAGRILSDPQFERDFGIAGPMHVDLLRSRIEAIRGMLHRATLGARGMAKRVLGR